jgi:glycerol uptake facilitator-like aquaporin
MKKLGKALLWGIGGALIAFIVVSIINQSVNPAVGPGLAAFVIFFIYGLFQKD